VEVREKALTVKQLKRWDFALVQRSC